MLHLSFLALVISAFPLVTRAQSVADALRLANASAFADYVEGNPAILAQLSDPAIKTIFAPNDAAFKTFLSNETNTRRLMVRQQVINHDLAAQLCDNVEDAAHVENPPGAVIKTGNDGVVVGQPEPDDGPINQPPVNATNAKIRRRQDATASRAVLFSGLGHTVGIVKRDTPFANGLIQTTDGFFTAAESFASTFDKTGASNFTAGFQSTNLSAILDHPDGATVFTVANDAYQGSLGNVSSSAQLAQSLSGYIVPKFRGYLPVLKDGDRLTTLAGTTLTVRIRGGRWFINGVRVIHPNQITTNGVSHGLEKPLQAVPGPVITRFTGVAWSMSPSRSTLAACGVSLLVTLLVRH